MEAPRRIYLEDLAVGQKFVSRTQEVTADAIIAFGRQFDPQPFHTDAVSGERSVFKGLVASGWHTAAITMRLLVEDGPTFGDGTIGLSAEVTWPKPTRAGDVVRVHGEIIEIAPSTSGKPRGTVTVRMETRNQRGEVVQTCTSKVLVPKR
jgi:acyl dehydratase